MSEFNFLKQLRILAVAEGISYLLFGITMPLKYVYEITEPNYYIGMLHGLLFVLFCIWTLIVARKYNLSLVTTLVCLASSLVPFGTFVIDQKILKKMVTYTTK